MSDEPFRRGMRAVLSDGIRLREWVGALSVDEFALKAVSRGR